MAFIVWELLKVKVISNLSSHAEGYEKPKGDSSR